MEGPLKKIWHDPVWSKVIAWGICGVLGAVGVLLWSKSDFSGTWAIAWPAAKSYISAAIDWLASPPTEISRGGLLLLMGFVLAVCTAFEWIWLTSMRDNVRTNTRTWVDANSRAAAELANERVAAATVAPKVVPNVGPLVTPLPAPEDLSAEERRLLGILYDHYPRPVVLKTLAAWLQLAYARTERVCEKMHAIGLVEITAADAPGVFLAKRGRDFYEDSGLSLVE